MELFDKIKIYLPQYLSSQEHKKLFKELAQFPTDGTKETIYTSALNNSDYLLQGDGIKNMPYLDFPNTEINELSAILLSNTCDMSTDNHRLNSCRVLYSPIINFEKYKNALYNKFDKERVDNHIQDIKKQHISQLLYLPKGAGLEYDGLVFFDRTISIPLKECIVKKMCTNKIFTLSNFGFYLFLIKISIHFTRIQEKIDRNTGIDIGESSK